MVRRGDSGLLIRGMQVRILPGPPGTGVQASVAQLVDAPDSDSGGCGFESYHWHQTRTEGQADWRLQRFRKPASRKALGVRLPPLPPGSARGDDPGPAPRDRKTEDDDRDCSVSGEAGAHGRPKTGRTRFDSSGTHQSGVAQLARAPDSDSGGRGFESLTRCQFTAPRSSTG